MNRQKKGVIVVSNRSPYDFDKGEVRRGAGGLVTAMENVLGPDGVWIGVSRGSDNFKRADENHRIPFGNIRMRKVFVTEIQYRHYYNEFANEFLWPLMHLSNRRLDLESEMFPTPHFSRVGFEGYLLVNRAFATAVMEELLEQQDDNIWVHDYHFMLLSREVRKWVVKRKKDTKIGQFWHIPWFDPTLLDGLVAPKTPARTRVTQLVKGLLSNSLLGFHSNEYMNNFVRTVEHISIGARVLRHRAGYTIERKGHRMYVGVFPIGINVSELKETTASSHYKVGQRIRSYDIDEMIAFHKKKGRKVLVGLERMDYTKGILERLDMIDELLRRQEVVYIAFAQPSRSGIASYDLLKRRVTDRAREINKKYIEKIGYKPIIFEMRRGISIPHNYLLLQKADACLVTTLADGMNLVVLESIMAKHALPRGKRGAVIIGECGAGYVLKKFKEKDGLVRLKDPLNISTSARQIQKALLKRISVSDELIRYVETHLDIHTWGDSFLRELERAP